MAALDGKGAIKLPRIAASEQWQESKGRQLTGLLVGAMKKCIGECNSSKATQHARPCIQLPRALPH